MLLLSFNNISKSGVKSNNPPDIIRLAFSLSPENLKKEFQKLGVEINNEEDVKNLIILNEKGFDKKGMVEKDGRKIIFDTLRVIENVHYSKEDFNKIKSISFIP